MNSYTIHRAIEKMKVAGFYEPRCQG